MPNLKEVVAHMMRQNTGKSILDSGDYYGRKYEMLANVDLDAQPEATLDKYGYSKSMYHHLCNTLYSVAELDELYLDYDKNYPNDTWVDTWERFLTIHNAIYNVENTYNFQTTIDGVFQVYDLEIDGYHYTAIMTHNGCDVRGGYSQPRIFNGVWEDVLGGITDGYIACPNGHYWTTDDAYHWYAEGWSGGKTTLEELWDNELEYHKCPECEGKITA